MFTETLSTIRTIRILIAIPLVFLLVACGNRTSSTSGVSTSQNGASPTISSSTSPATNPISSSTPSSELKAIDFNVANLHIHAPNPIMCVNFPTLFYIDSSYFKKGNLVLATNRLTYDSSELQQMREYTHSVLDGHASSMPKTLQWASGTAIGNFLTSPQLDSGCLEQLEITNLGNNPTIIGSMSVQLTSIRTQNNSTHYRLIDSCTLGALCYGGTAGGGPQIYYFLFKAESPNTVLTPASKDVSADYQCCTDVVLNPGDIIPVVIFFASLDPFAFSIVPNLVLDTQIRAQQIIALPQLATTLYFANPNQFSCYALQGDTFVPAKPPYYNNNCV
jgi:hypothetical protein